MTNGNPDVVQTMPPRKEIEVLNVVGVVGAGVIGTGVAQSLAHTGHSVILIDTSEGILENSLATVRRDSRLHHLVSPSREKLDVEAVLARIRPSTDIADLASADFVIENVTEDWMVKRDVYEALDRVCPQGCVLAANTSAIMIARIAEATTRPAEIVGMHFMNPVPLKPVVEVIRAPSTSEDTLAKAKALLSRMGKRAVIVSDSPGFVSNRVLMPAINEAAKVLEEGVASAHDIDDVFVSCFGHTMGPLATADLIGVDTVVRTLHILSGEMHEPYFEPCALLREMVEDGKLGRKSGEGFYRYSSHTHEARELA